MIAIRDSNLSKNNDHLILEDKRITQKEFGRKLVSQSKVAKDNTTSWTNRALDWYNSERRLIFAVDPLSSTFREIDKQFFMGEITSKIISNNQTNINQINQAQSSPHKDSVTTKNKWQELLGDAIRKKYFN